MVDLQNLFTCIVEILYPLTIRLIEADSRMVVDTDGGRGK